jgi:antitoxin (DNA-binding transcriptional repressor) of toxin-antitoxin stability system
VTEINLADAKSTLSALVEQVLAGGTVDILRRGKAVARLTAVSTQRKRIDASRLRALTAGLPRQSDSADFVRSMREDDRY